MAANMDALIRIGAKVQGLNEFKALSDRLLDVEQASGNTKAGFQQLTAESNRLANEVVRGGQSVARAANNIRDLGRALAPTDDQLAKVREELLALSSGSKVTERSLNQQVQALKALQSQASIGGAVYRQLGRDIQALGDAYKEAATGVKTFTDAQRASQIVGAKPKTFNAQIEALNNQLQDLSIYSEEYAAKLTEIQQRQLSFNTAMARQGVIAAAAAYGQGGKNAGQALPELPNTTAGLNQRLSELNTELVNLTIGGQDWIRVSREIANVQRSLNQEFDKAPTHYKSPIGPAAPSALFQSIGAISDQTSANQLQLMGRSYGEVAESIRRAAAASDGSVNSLQRQRAAWQALQNAVNPAAPAYERARKNAERLDEQIRRLTATQEKAARAGAGREAIGSALGSLAAGGGFQGAVGALAGGLAFSGGAGALAAGAAITGLGAAGALASRVGVEAETAQVRLKALTEQFGEYNQAQAAAARIAQTLRISQTEATDSFSKLYGALRPTGVTLQEVEDAFIGFTAAARASGATATESSAALLQLKQALGSGVLQGDELRSIREQAPAAAQAIAREMGVTIGELKKLGSEGKITTDIVLRALARLKGESLEKLNAQSNTSAQALQDLRLSADQFGQTIARVFGPAAVATVRGLGDAIREVNAVMGALTGDGGAQGRIQDMQRARSQAQRDTDRRAFGLFDAQGRQGFFQQRTQQLFQQFQRQRADQASRAAAASGASAGQLAERQAAERERMLGRLLLLLGRGGGGGGSAKEAADQEQRLAQETARERIELNDRLHQNAMALIRKRYEYERELQNQSADNWVKRYTGAARSAAGIISGALRGFDELKDRQRESELGILDARQALSSAKAQAAVTGGGGGFGDANFTASQLQAATKEASRFNGIANMCAESVKAFYKSLGVSLPGVTAWADTVRKAGKTMTDWSKLRPGDIVATGRPGDTPHVGVYTGGDSVFHQSRSRGLRAGNYPDLGYFKQGGYFVRPSAMDGGAPTPAGTGNAMQASAGLAQAQALAAMEKGQVEKLKTSIGEGFVLDFTDQLRQQNAELENQNAITQLRNRLQMEGVRPEIIEAETQKAQKIREVAEQTKVAGDALKILEQAGEGASVQADRLREVIGLQNENLQLFIDRTNAATSAQIGQGVALGTYIGQLRQQLNEMGNIERAAITMSQTIETEISSAMSAAIGSVVTGTGSVKQATAEMMRNIGASFVQMSTQIIAKQTVMIVLGTIMKALGIAMPGGGGFSPLSNADATSFSFNPSSMMEGPGFTPFAKGGVVSRPTFFKFANGGAMQNGLMGEAGPEAIVPLKRGFDGRLGIAQVPAPRGGDSRMRELMGSSPAQGAASPVLNMSFETTNINGVEYVSRDQLESAMAETRRAAARDGAKRGMSMTLDKLQQSPSTRSRVGLR